MIIISVITPSFNSGTTLQDTLNSVYRLSESIASYGLQLELIVVDGGSSDSTLDMQIGIEIVLVIFLFFKMWVEDLIGL